MNKKLNHSQVDLSFCSAHFNITDDSFIRVFSKEVPDSEFEWHRDEKNRKVIVVYSRREDNWKFQFDNGLPFVLETNDEVIIEKEEFHKLHKGKGTLVLYVQESQE